MSNPAPQAVPSMIEAVFAKLLLVYGQRFVQFLSGQDVATVKRHWTHELRGITENDLAYGLTVLPPDYVPNVLQFKAACQRAPVQSVRAIAGPPASPERVKAVLERMHAATAHLRGNGTADPKAWAWKLLKRHESGERIPSCHLRMARDALERELEALRSAQEADA
jgi:hypothetical protein